MSSQNPARYLAPVALVAAALAILIVWQSTLGDDEPQAGSSPASQTTSTGTTSTTSGGAAEEDGSEGGSEGDSQADTYTVEAGDNLSSIAEETGVSVDRILELNEDVDPQGLQAGDELTIRP